MQAKNCSCSSALGLLGWWRFSSGGDDVLGKFVVSDGDVVLLFGSQGNGSVVESGGASSSCFSSVFEEEEICGRLVSL